MKKLLLLSLLILSTICLATVIFYQPVDITLTVTSQEVLPIDQFRSYLLIQNKGDDIVYIKMDTAQAGTEGIKIQAGGSYEPSKVPRNAIHMRANSATQLITVIRGR